MKRGPKPGYRQTDQHRASIAAGMRAHWERVRADRAELDRLRAAARREAP
jgi:hypothetical protein